MTAGRTWLLLHGTPLTPMAWRRTAALLAPDPVRIPDGTSVPIGDDPQRTMAAAIAASVEGPLDVVGHSFGGQIALELALLVPDRVRSLTILCSRDTPFPAFAATADAVRAGRLPAVDATLARWFSPDELRGADDAVRDTRAELLRASALDWARALDAIAVYDSSTRTPHLTMPVTLIAAGHDAVATPDAMAELAGRLPDAMLTVHPDWFHMSAFTRPAQLAGMLRGARDRS